MTEKLGSTQQRLVTVHVLRISLEDSWKIAYLGENWFTELLLHGDLHLLLCLSLSSSSSSSSCWSSCRSTTAGFIQGRGSTSLRSSKCYLLLPATRLALGGGLHFDLGRRRCRYCVTEAARVSAHMHAGTQTVNEMSTDHWSFMQNLLFVTTLILSVHVYFMCLFRGLPSINWRPSRWAWFGRSLLPHQSFWSPHQRSKVVEGIGSRYADRAWGEYWLIIPERKPIIYMYIQCAHICVFIVVDIPERKTE